MPPKKTYNFPHSNIDSITFRCGYCGERQTTNQGHAGNRAPEGHAIYILMCHSCGGPTLFDAAKKQQVPGYAHGDSVTDITDQNVRELYEEARNCTAAGAFTAAVLCCRKLLMHIAVAKGAKEDESFAHYVKYLIDNHYVPPGSDDWVKHIKDKGNEANHQIVIMKSNDAELLLTYSGMLLKMIYEFPARLKREIAPPAPPTKPV